MFLQTLRSFFKTLILLTFSTFLALSLLLTLPPRITLVPASHFWESFQRNPKIQNALEIAKTQQYIPECSCIRKYFYSQKSSTKRLASTCSDPGTFYEPNQKVISYSLYFSNRTKKAYLDQRFQKGLRENVKLMRKHYPGYSMRVYTDLTLTQDDEFCKILCANPEIFWCDIRQSPSLGNQQDLYFRMWRFLVLGDESVDHFLSRDIDTYIIPREAAAVEDWLRHSTKAIHVMRDFKKGHNLEMLAGMWGASNTRLGWPTATKLRQDVFKERKANQAYPTPFDQDVLRRKIFYPKRALILAHDSYHCQSWRKWTLLRPFPTCRSSQAGDFVGNYIYMKMPVEKCPTVCRPSYGRDWEYC